MKHLLKMQNHKVIRTLPTLFLLPLIVFSLFNLGTNFVQQAQAATYTAGVTTIGPILDSGNNNGISSTQVTTGANAGTLSTIKVYIGAVNAQPKNHMQVAIYADNGSDAPGALLSSSAAQVLTKNSWNSFTMSGVTINANTKYWLGFNVDGANTKYAKANNGIAKSAWRIPTTYGTWPNPFGTPTEPITASNYSIYMTYESVSAPTATPTPTTAPTATPTFTPTPTPGSGCVGVTVNTSDDLQSLINANGTGTTFCLQSGTHRVSVAGGLTPKTGDIFRGVGQNAYISGSKLVTGWTVNGSDWVATGFLPSSPSTFGTCASGYPLCGQAQDIFRDGTWLSPVSSRAELSPGKAYLDFANNKIYVRDDPTGHNIEQSWAARLFTGSATGVQIKNLTLQHAASVSNTGAIDPSSGGTGWILDHNEIRWNHGYGTGPGQVAFGETLNMTITANNVHHNGQDGTGADGVGNVVQGNEVHHNSYAGYDVLWDGGNKFGHARNLVVTGNYYHDERGVGIWCDINCEDVTIANNYVARTQRGIMYEISCRASIHDNIVVDSTDNASGSWGGIGILVSNSEGVEAYNNKTYNDNRGIWAVNTDRTEARDCTGGAEHVTKNLNVHNNDMDLNGQDAPWGAKVGLWSDQGRTDLYATLNNSFSANTYHDTTPSSEWNWGMTSPPYTDVVNFSTWQSRGQDATGSVVNDDPTPPAPPSLVTGPQP